MLTQSTSASELPGQDYGGSAEAIRSHYDIGNEFWKPVLGPTMAYSSALYHSPGEDLDTAQQRKLNWHIRCSGAATARSVLDVGCGWGSLLRPLSEKHKVPRVVGITLSDAQAQYMEALRCRGVEVRVENWSVHKPDTAYDAIVSVGAFEHFAKPRDTVEQKIAVYRDFFEHCHRWLAPSGRMSLQTIAYGNMRREDASVFINDVIFPESDLPRLAEIVAAAEGLFEIVALRNDRFDYARTMEAWARNLQATRDGAVRVVGEDKVADMERFFRMASVGFRMGKQYLLRLALRPIRSKWRDAGSEDWTTRPA
jgi:cyclopropane-fatty-acyl-phospholipid synthase